MKLSKEIKDTISETLYVNNDESYITKDCMVDLVRNIEYVVYAQKEDTLEKYNTKIKKRLNKHKKSVKKQFGIEFNDEVINYINAFIIDDPEPIDPHIGCPAYPNCDEMPTACIVESGITNVEWVGHRD